jgi:hypothetical protein
MATKSSMIPLIRFITLACFFVMVLPIKTLALHSSQGAAISQRYSLPYFIFLLAFWGLLILLLILSLLPTKAWAKIQYLFGNLFFARILKSIWWLPGVLSLVILIFVLNLIQRWTPGQSFSLQFALMIFTLWFNIVLYILIGSIRALKALALIFVAVVSVIITFGLIEIFLRMQPNLIPREIRASLPGGGRYLVKSDFQLDNPIRVGFRYGSFQDRWIQFDPFGRDQTEIEGIVGPYGNNRTQPLQIHFVTDENGFLNSPPVNGSSFDIVAVGDSFLTWTAEEHWLKILSQITGFKALNLGMPGWGTQSEVEALEIYGLDKKPDWVILAYFEGNDLWDAKRYEERHSSGWDWIEYDEKTAGFWQTLVVPYMLNYGIKQFKHAIQPPEYAYPLDVRMGDNTLRLAFSHQYVGALSANAEDIEKSRNFELVADALLKAKQLSESIGAQLLIVYIPAEEHVYLPYIKLPQQLNRVVKNIPIIALNDQGYLEMGPGPAELALITENMDDQAQVIQSFANEHSLAFLNLTPSFQAEAGKGKELYNYSDTHWNNAGQNLAAKVIAEYILATDR